MFENVSKESSEFISSRNIQKNESVNNSFTVLTSKRNFFQNSYSDRINTSASILNEGISVVEYLFEKTNTPIDSYSKCSIKNTAQRNLKEQKKEGKH